MSGRHGDAKFHLARVVEETVQPAVSDHRARRLLDNRELEPRPLKIGQPPGLLSNYGLRVVEVKRRPGLKARHFWQRTISVESLGISGLQRTQEKARGR